MKELDKFKRKQMVERVKANIGTQRCDFREVSSRTDYIYCNYTKECKSKGLPRPYASSESEVVCSRQPTCDLSKQL